MKKKMKKRSEWVRKSDKRIKKEKDRGIVDFVTIQNCSLYRNFNSGGEKLWRT